MQEKQQVHIEGEADGLTRRHAVAGLLGTGFVAGIAVSGQKASAGTTAATWIKLPTEPYPGKQDDIHFVSQDIGWYGNGKGRLFGTSDGGASWNKLFDQPGTVIRALGFVDERVGIFGNIGPGSFPGVTDTVPVYRTEDGGRSWTPIRNIAGPVPSGICAIDVLRAPYVNSGVLDYRVTLRAGGRVGGPAHLMTSVDLGMSWTSVDMTSSTAMILDVHFINERVGFIAGASDADVSASNAVVLKTTDGGRTWRRVYVSKRPFEITWKMSFPTAKIGYVTVQNYSPDVGIADRVVAKTVDGGETWRELPLASDHKLQELGIGFVDAQRGWVGGSTGGYKTTDGGKTWTSADMGRAVNKIRVMRDGPRTRVFAIGTEVRRLDLP